PGLMRKTAADLARDKHHAALLVLAWQCWQVGDQTLADELLGSAFAGVSGTERQALTLAAVEYLWQTNQLPRADAMLQPLLADEELSKLPSLWRLGAAVATRRGMLARAAACLEKAMDLEYRDL